MIYLAIIIFIAGYAFMNRVAGGILSPAPGGDLEATAGWWLLTCGMSYLINHNFEEASAMGAIFGIGLFLWRRPGLEHYFGCVYGDWPSQPLLPSDYQYIIEKIGLKIYPLVSYTKSTANYQRGILCMGLRGGIFSAPLMVACIFYGQPVAILLWPLFFLQGFVYFLFRPIANRGISPISYCEWAWGVVLAVIALIII